MLVAEIAFNALRGSHGRITPGAHEAVEKLTYYGYEVVCTVNRYAELTEAMDWLKANSLSIRVGVRGEKHIPSLIFDSRCPSWSGFRVAMVHVDEKHRKDFIEYRILKDKQHKDEPVACSITPNEIDDDCPS